MVSVSVDLREASWKHKHACETSSFSIIPVNDNSCILLWSTAFITAGFLGKISFTLPRPCLMSAFRYHLDQELEDYVAAGLALQERKRSSS
jgi:hypothetical protein